MSDLQIRKATRQGVRPIIDLYSESGGGKTFSALLLARGFVGETGKIVMVDTESGRGELYSDVPEIGGYDVVPLGEPFSPSRYIDAIDVVEASGAAIGVLDSASHCWEGIGGVLDMAATSEANGTKGLHNWVKPKLAHAQFVQKLLRSTIPWIICLRAKFKTKQIKVNGKTEIVKDEFLTPLQSDDFIFEATVHGMITLDHKFIPTKISHPELGKCLPNNEPITKEHGRLLAVWCANPGKTPPSNTSKLLLDLRTLTLPISKWDGQKDSWQKAKGLLQSWLIEQTIIADSEDITSLSHDRLVEVLSETRAALNPQTKELL